MNRVFVLSPADCNGVRAQWLLKRNSRSDLAVRLRASGATLGEVFSFLSALYFRGKLAYSQTFARPPSGCPGVWVITPKAGLVAHDCVIRLAQLQGYGRVPIGVKNRRYSVPLRQSAARLAGEIGIGCEVVLLGSLASGKYLDILLPVFGQRLRVPTEFIGLGDMSRGGLLLRCLRENRELDYLDAQALPKAPKRRFSNKRSPITVHGRATGRSPLAPSTRD